MAACSSQMRLRKRSSAGSIDSMSCVPRSPTTEVLGRAKLDLPDTSGRSSFYLSTHWTGQGSLRHYLSGLRTLERHELLIQILRATDHSGKRHIVDIQFEMLYEDGPNAGDKVRAVFDVIIRVVDSVVTKPDVTDVTFEQCCYIRIRHAALIGQFLRVADNNTLCLDVPGSPDDYVFRCYFFFGHNKTVCRRGRGRCPRRCRRDGSSSSSSSSGGGGGGGCGSSWPKMCVLQDPRSSRYIVASALSGRLKADNDGQLHTDIQTIEKPDSRFFILHQSGDGDSHQFCLMPLLLCNHFLRYDAVEGLKLKRCDRPPYQDPYQVQYFSFDFMPAENH